MKMYRSETSMIAQYRHFETNTAIDICLVYKFQCNFFFFLDTNNNIDTDSFWVFFKWKQKTLQPYCVQVVLLLAPTMRHEIVSYQQHRTDHEIVHSFSL